MGKTFTPLKITFFGLLLAAVIVVQYCWVNSLLKENQEQFKSLVIISINDAGRNTAAMDSIHMTKALGQALADNGLRDIPFECKFVATGKTPTTHLSFQYIFNKKVCEVVVPFWKSIVWRQTTWAVVTAVLLTIMILVIFGCAVISGRTGFYNEQTNAVNHLIQQLETPLSTVSVAAEALRNARVTHNPREITYYQQVIDKENRLMNEQVDQFLKNMK